jgi:PAS domain S-box-containing protein
MNHLANETGSVLQVRPVPSAIITFLLLASICAFLSYQRLMILRSEDRQIALNIAESGRSRLQQALQYSLSATQAMTLLIDANGNVNNFDSIAPLIYRAHKHIDALQLVPGGVIKYVYPPAENRAVVNYDILRDPARNKEAYKAIQKRELFFGGPFKLKQGGIGIVGRLPVFINNKPWGFSAVVIRLSTLLKAAGIDSSGKSGFYYQLSKLNPDTQEEEFFLPFRGKSASHYEVAVDIPNGEWVLSVMPVNGYSSVGDILLLGFLGLVLSVLGASFVYYYSKTPERLKGLVEERTTALEKSEERNKTIVRALPDMVFIVDQEGRLVDVNNAGQYQAIFESGEFINRNITDVLPAPLAAEMNAYVKKVLATGRVHSHHDELRVNGEVRNYETRFVPYRNEEVLIIVRDSTDIKKTERELIRSRSELRRLSNYLEDVREEERLHIAREIHDELGQHLTLLKMNFSFLEKNLKDSTPGYTEDLQKITHLISEMVTAVRKISHELRPAVLDQLGLAAAMEWYANDFEKKANIKVSLISDYTEHYLPDKLRTGLFRIFQESLTNVARHAEATRVDVSLHFKDGELMLLIEDNGKGFDTAIIDGGKTLGVLGMKERALGMGGTYNIHSKPGKGTVIDVVIPLATN